MAPNPSQNLLVTAQMASSEELGINDAEKKYWHVYDEVKKLRSDNYQKRQLGVLEGEMEQLAQNNHPLLAYYKELLDQNRNESINQAEEQFAQVKKEANASEEQMTEFLKQEFIKVTESIFGTFMEVLNERKKVLERDRETGNATSFNRKEQGKNSKDISMPYTKMLLNENETPAQILEKISANRKKTLSRPGDRLKQSEIDQDINLVRLHVQYRPEKSRRANKRQKREREPRIEREDIYSEDDLARNDTDGSRTNRPRRRARRVEVKETYSDEFSDD